MFRPAAGERGDDLGMSVSGRHDPQSLGRCQLSTHSQLLGSRQPRNETCVYPVAVFSKIAIVTISAEPRTDASAPAGAAGTGEAGAGGSGGQVDRTLES